MRAGVESDADVRVAHDILQSLGIHSALGHVGAEGVAADMRRDLRQLHLVNADDEILFTAYDDLPDRRLYCFSLTVSISLIDSSLR